MRFFCQANVNNQPYENSLYRYRDFEDLVIEEFWNTILQIWEPTLELTRLLIGGDCTLIQITEESAKSLQDIKI